MSKLKKSIIQIVTALIVVFMDKYVFKYEDIVISVVLFVLIWYLTALLDIALDGLKLCTRKRIYLNLAVSTLFIIISTIVMVIDIADFHMIFKASLAFIVSIFVNSEYLKDNSREKIDNE